MYYSEKSTLTFSCDHCSNLKWKGKTVPHDRLAVEVRRIDIQSRAHLVMSTCMVVGVITAIAFLVFNLYHRNVKHIRMSSPNLNNCAVFGCALVYLACLTYGLTSRVSKQLTPSVLCMGRAYLFTTGFSLAFGSMFCKTYRVHQIFKKENRGVLYRKLLKDRQLFLLIGALLVVDTIYMAVWLYVDPLREQLRNLTAIEHTKDVDMRIVPQIIVCDCDSLNVWISVLYGSKAMLLLFGVHMAWETRLVHVPELNDSQYIGMNIYNVVLCSVTVVISNVFIHNSPTVAYVVTMTLVFLSTTIMLCLLFCPKMYAVWKVKDTRLVVTSSGVTFQGRTRRFIVDERKEKYHRAEVENRYLKKRLVEVDCDIRRLRRILQLVRRLPRDEDRDDDAGILLQDADEYKAVRGQFLSYPTDQRGKAHRITHHVLQVSDAAMNTSTEYSKDDDRELRQTRSCHLIEGESTNEATGSTIADDAYYTTCEQDDDFSVRSAET